MSATVKQKEDFKNCISLLGSYVDTYEKGNPLIYLPMAVELRKLFAERQGEGPLLELVIPGIQLHKLRSTELFENSPSLLVGLENFMPGELSLNQYGVPTFNLSFTRNQIKLAAKEWVNQMFFKEGISVYELIKSVADKEAAHSDKNYNETLKHCKSWLFSETESHILGIYGLAKYVYDLVTIEHKEFLV